MSNKSCDRIGNVVIDYTYYCGEDLYSEGAAEDRLLDYVKNHTALDYEHYIQESRSWSVMYHLSYIRENVAGWLPIGMTDKVLEIGSGCGAVTGALAQLAGSVTCVELSKKRSLINAYRNREYDNISILVGNFEDVEKGLEEKYDYITLIGVLEYAASYINGDRPYHRFLEILKDHLAPGGKIVIAIENRLGMKYFAGCKEDHLGKYFGGIEGYANDAKVRTFSRESLENLLTEAGLYDSRFYYPYPDYKLPHTIYSDEWLPGTGELNTNLRNYDADRLVLFDETKAFDAMIEEGRFPEFANSFIVVTSPEKGWQEKLGTVPVFAKYGNERIEDYRVCTIINRSPDGIRKVYKMALSTHANAHVGRMANSFQRLSEQFSESGFVPAKCTLIKGQERGILFAGVASKAKDAVRFEYASGRTLEDCLNEFEEDKRYPEMEKMILEYCRRLSLCGDTREFKRSAKFDEVFGKRDFKKKYAALMPCNFDMIFSNIVVDGDDQNGKWTVLDYEWVWDFAIPIQFVIYRALYYHFRDRKDDGFAVYLSRKGLDVYSLCGIDIGERVLFNEMEHSFQVYIIGGAASLEVMQILMPTTTIRINNIVKIGAYLRNLDTPRVYFSRGTNFSSENQICVIGEVDEGHVKVHIPFERYINSLRIDPTEYPCLLHLEGLYYTLNDGRRLDTDRITVNGYKLSEDTYLYDTNDAQLVIGGIPQNAKSVDVAYHITMVEEPFYEVILNVLKREEEAKQEEKRRFSYRLKRKLGIIKEDILPEGFVRADLSGSGKPV